MAGKGAKPVRDLKFWSWVAAAGIAGAALLTAVMLLDNSGRLAYLLDPAGSFVEPQAPVASSSGSVEPAAHVVAPVSDPVDLNTATFEELCLLPGVGEVIARGILDYREVLGGFKAVEELLEVPRIGPAVLEKIRPYVIVRRPDVSEP
jgi:competence ComEA-like helix-hairpin-helix protein